MLKWPTKLLLIKQKNSCLMKLESSHDRLLESSHTLAGYIIGATVQVNIKGNRNIVYSLPYPIIYFIYYQN